MADLAELAELAGYEWESTASASGFVPPQGRGGRVPDGGRGTGPPAPFQMFASGGGGPESGGQGGAGAFVSDSLAHTVMVSDVAKLFMSPANVDVLQEAIRYRVYVDSGRRHVISRQSETELAVIMRSVLLRNGRNVNDRALLTEQVRALNTAVLEYAVPVVQSAADALLRYRDDISALPMPMERGALATSKGERSLVMKNFF